MLQHCAELCSFLRLYVYTVFYLPIHDFFLNLSSLISFEPQFCQIILLYLHIYFTLSPRLLFHTLFYFLESIRLYCQLLISLFILLRNQNHSRKNVCKIPLPYLPMSLSINIQFSHHLLPSILYQLKFIFIIPQGHCYNGCPLFCLRHQVSL